MLQVSPLVNVMITDDSKPVDLEFIFKCYIDTHMRYLQRVLSTLWQIRCCTESQLWHLKVQYHNGNLALSESALQCKHLPLTQLEIAF